MKAKLKNNREITIRPLSPQDEEKLFLMFSSMSYEALKWSKTPFSRSVIRDWIGNLSSIIALVVECDNSIIGLGFIQKFYHDRRKGVGDLTIYLHHSVHNLGLGSIIMEKLLKLAKKDRMHKIEHSIVLGNKAAIGLYKKFDFKIEGLIRESYMDTDGKYHDLVHMGLILE